MSFLISCKWSESQLRNIHVNEIESSTSSLSLYSGVKRDIPEGNRANTPEPA